MYKTEQAIIGSILVNTAFALPIAADKVTPDDFENERCKTAFRCMLRHSGQENIDYVLLAGEMGTSADDKGYNEWLADTLNGTPTAANVGAYCDLLLKERTVRRLTEVVDGAENVEELTEEVDREIETLKGIINKRELKDTLAMYNEFMAYYDNVRKNPNFGILKTGYKQFDSLLGGGLVKGGFYVIGARPGMGKTTFALNIAEKIAEAQKPVLFVSLEMTAVQIMAKRMGNVCNIPYKQILTASLSEKQERALFEKVNTSGMSGRPFYLYDGDHGTVSGIATAARKIEGLSCIIIDYLGLLQTASPDKKLYEQVTEISRDIKRLALQMNIPIIALCQLNRQSQQTKDKKPSLSDLRDSGAIEQDADGVFLLFRQEYYNKPEEQNSVYHDLEVNIAKNRHGDTGIIKMTWIGVTGRVIEPDRREATSEQT